MAFSIFFLAGFLAHLLLGGFLILTFLRYRRLFPLPHMGYLFGILAVPYAILAVLELSWLLGLVTFFPNDLLYAYTLVSMVVAIALVLLIQSLMQNRNIFYLFFLYAIALIGASLKIDGIFALVLGLSYLLLLLLFLDIIFFTNRFLQKAGIFGAVYAAGFLVLLTLSSLGVGTTLLFAFIPDLFLLAAMFFLFASIRRFGMKQKAKVPFCANFLNSLFFVRFLVYITVISVFLFVSILATHELGHALTADFFGCSYSKAVIYDVLNPPHTEIGCFNKDYNAYITLAGLLFTVGICGLFFIVGDQFASRAAFLMLGFSLIMVYGDFIDLGVSGSMILVTMLLSLFFISIGVVLLSLYYINQHVTPDCKKEENEPKSINASASPEGKMVGK